MTPLKDTDRENTIIDRAHEIIAQYDIQCTAGPFCETVMAMAVRIARLEFVCGMESGKEE